MIDSFMLRPDYAELSKAVHSTSAAITTVFLFSRLFSRTTRFNGLWYDDYLLIASWVILVTGNGMNIAGPIYGFNLINGTTHGWSLVLGSSTLFYYASSLAKSAFIVTLLRLTTGKTKVMLGVLLAVTWGLTFTVSVAMWLKVCDALPSVGYEGNCMSLSVSLWIHMSMAFTTVVTDLVLGYLPWKMLSTVYLPKSERVGVGISMSMVAIAAVVCVARTTIIGLGQRYSEVGNIKDWSYGTMTCFCLQQAEVAIYIVAQAIPMIRVLAFGSGTDITGVLEEEQSQPSKPAPYPGLENIPEASMELVVLSSGRVVMADSEDARAERATATTPAAVGGPVASKTGTQHVHVQQEPAHDPNDPVHKAFEDMGLSKRAWSKSPSTSPATGPAVHQRGISDVSDDTRQR